ncbi:NAD(P)/FAD-dependent oxidoreductase [Rhodobacter lacus]|uniref:NAD(P)/FAD-dependent oxidoreductase n=1 Tax=Rhodobacter lacus TaxID=1641972 RepID=A0ABW5A9A0_9RHOB
MTTVRRTEPPYERTAVAAPPTEALSGAVQVDFALVGAGYGGLLTAIELAQKGANVAVVEAHEVGCGGSGRNHGQCIPIYGYVEAPWVPSKGRDLLVNSSAQVFEMVRRYKMNCEAVQNGLVTAAYNARTLATTKAAQARYARYGKSDAYYSAAELAELTGIASGFLGGWVHKDGGHLNPLGYTRELARVAISLGVRVFTQSPVTSLARKNGAWDLKTPGGEIRARRVGLTTDAYSEQGVPGRVRRGFFPLECYGLASRPLTEAERRAVMPGGMNFGDTHRDPMFFRIDCSGRLITGGLVEPKRGRDFAYTSAFMTRRLAQLWPELAGLSWEHMWSGTISMALDQTPTIRDLGEGLWALSGWSGRGVPTSAALSVAFARTLEDAATGLDYWPHRHPPKVFGGAILGQIVQLCRGPFNQTRDRFGL